MLKPARVFVKQEAERDELRKQVVELEKTLNGLLERLRQAAAEKRLKQDTPQRSTNK
jgi:hypothetical protein